MTDLTILGAPQSPYVWVTRIASAEKGVPYTLDPAMPHSAEVSAIHPFGKIPVMRHGAVTLCESRAICLYIDRTFSGPSLVPQDPIDAAHSEQWVSILMTHVDPVFVRSYIGGYYFPHTDDGTPDRARIDPALAPLEAQFQVLDREVGRTGHLVGGSFTLADAYLVTFLFYASKLPETSAMLRRSSSLRNYFDRHIRRASVQQTIPPAFGHEPMSAERVSRQAATA